MIQYFKQDAIFKHLAFLFGFQKEINLNCMGEQDHKSPFITFVHKTHFSQETQYTPILSKQTKHKTNKPKHPIYIVKNKIHKLTY